MCSLSDVTLAIVDCEHKTAPTQPFGIPSIRTTDIKNGRLDLRAAKRVSEETYREWTARMEPQEGDLILAREAPVSEVGLVPPDTRVCLGQRTVLVRPDPEKAVPRYLLFLLLTPQMQHELKSRAEGSTTPHLNVGDIREFELPELPELPEQNRIAHVLGTLDDKIELNRQMNRALEEIARAIFKSWFIDFDPVIDNAILNGKPIPDEFAERAEVRREILARSQPSPPSPLPEVEGRNYRGGFEFAGLVEMARKLRQKQTPVEEILWELLRDRRFLDLKFRRQHQIGDYIADFYCHDHKLVIEVDGGIHRTQGAKDAKRNAYMESLGMTVLRFPNDAVLNTPDYVLSRVAHVADQFSSTSGRGARGEGVASYRHLFPDSFQNSPLGKIPEGWEVRPFSEIIEINPSRSLKKGVVAPYVDMSSLPTSGSQLETPPSTREYSSGSRFRNGDVLFARITPCLENGKTVLADFLKDGEIGAGSTEFLVFGPRLAGTYFAYCASRWNAFREHATASMTGTSGRQRAQKEAFDHLQMAVPDSPGY